MPDSSLPDELHRYREYLTVLARQGLRKSVQGKVDPSDIVQEVLLQAIRMKHQFRGQSQGELLAWLRQILSRKLCDTYRHFAQDKRDVNLERSIYETVDATSDSLEQRASRAAASPSEQAERNEQMLAIAEKLQRLPANQREAIELHYLLGLSFSQVADEMQLTRNQVAGLIRRGLQKVDNLA